MKLVPMDLTKARDVTGQANEALVYANELSVSHACRLFELGATIVQNKSKLTIADICAYLDIPVIFGETLRTVAADCNCDIKEFQKKMQRKGCVSWQDYIKEYYPPDERSYGQDRKILAEIIDRIKSEQLPSEEKLEIIKTRDMINRLLPPGIELIDKNYLGYYDCCCCGREAAGKPFELKHLDKKEFLMYPVCPECLETNKKPDMERIAVMYASYALNTEQAFYKQDYDDSL